MRFVLFFLLISTSLTSQSDPDLTDAFRLLNTWLDAQKDYEKLPGISVGIVKDQDLIWSSGFGYSDVALENTASASTIYSICSISKLFTAIAILQLRDAGHLRLDDEISSILPWFKVRQSFEDSGPITVRGLLTHSSGLPRQSNFPYWTAPDFDFPKVEEIKAQINEMNTLYPASTFFQYSNFGLTILGAIIEQVSGIKYETYVKENILQVLQLKDTRPEMPKALMGGQLATGYGALTRDGSRDQLNAFFTEGITAAAGFTSTVEDMAKFASWQFRLLENGGKEVLKVSTLREMQRVHWMNPDWKTSWGLGFSVRQGSDGSNIVGHGGSCPGYRTQISLSPRRKMAYIVMVNAGGVSTGKYIAGMARVIGKALDADTNELAAGVNLQDYCGTYNAQPWSSETVILPWYGNLAIVGLPSDDPSSFTLLKHLEGDTFQRMRGNGEMGEKIVFERNTTGTVYRMKRHQNYSIKLK